MFARGDGENIIVRSLFAAVDLAEEVLSSLNFRQSIFTSKFKGVCFSFDGRVDHFFLELLVTLHCLRRYLVHNIF